MNPETVVAVELLTPWEAWLQPLLWYAVPNTLLNLMTTFWLHNRLRAHRRLGELTAVGAWTAFSVLIGLVWPAVTGPLAYDAWRDARRRRHAPRFWLGVVALLSFVGYLAYRVYDDANSRGMRAGRWAMVAGAWYAALCFGGPAAAVLSPTFRAALFAPARLLWSLPLGLVALAVFPAVYGAFRQRLRFDDVLRRWRDPSVPANVLLRVEDLKTWFPVRGGVFSAIRGYVRAVDGVCFDVRRGEVLGLVGESGCGKTTVGRTILGLVPLSAGRVLADGVDLACLNQAEWRAVREKLQVIFQDPIGSLNPRMTVGAIVAEGLEIHGRGSRDERRRRVAELLERVGLPADAQNQYPHEFSGGQRQRIGIARALALGADFIVCDEPVSALDVSIQAQIVNLMRDLQREFHMSYLFIAHDLAIVEHISDRVAVMYLGRIVEIAGRDEIYSRPLHPYTQALMASIPNPDPEHPCEAPPLTGDPPSPVNPPFGCRFRTRCPRVIPACAEAEPVLKDYGHDHQAACWRLDES